MNGASNACRSPNCNCQRCCDSSAKDQQWSDSEYLHQRGREHIPNDEAEYYFVEVPSRNSSVSEENRCGSDLGSEYREGSQRVPRRRRATNWLFGCGDRLSRRRLEGLVDFNQLQQGARRRILIWKVLKVAVKILLILPAAIELFKNQPDLFDE